MISDCVIYAVQQRATMENIRHTPPPPPNQPQQAAPINSNIPPAFTFERLIWKVSPIAALAFFQFALSIAVYLGHLYLMLPGLLYAAVALHCAALMYYMSSILLEC
jgi:hypothetical protein